MGYVCALAGAVAALGLLPGHAGAMGLSFGASGSTPPTSSAPAVAPAPAPSGPAVAIDAMSGPSGAVLAGGSAVFSVTAHDPAGGVLSYAWTTTGGALDAPGAAATLAAPAVAGPVTVTVTVTSTSGSAPATQGFTATVILENGLGALGDPLVGPHRLALAPEGWLYAVDGRGGFHVLTARGESMGTVPLPEPALAVAAGPGVAWVSTVGGRILRVDAAAARVVGSIDVGYASGPTGLAWDPAAGVLWLAERGAGQLRAIRPDGTTVTVLVAAGTLSLAGVTDVALDPASGLVWAALDQDVGQPMAVALDARSGAYARGILTGGTGDGQVARAGGIGVDAAGRVYVSDAFLGRVQVASSAGQYLGALGSFGSGAAQLREPAGVLPLPSGEILVANSDDGRIERYGVDAALPTCAGDSDCDGLPDAWELAHGLDPHWAGDALLDYDRDGLTNLQEYRLGTDPRNPDTDGDGVSDGEEVAAGTDPLVDDRKPVLTASDPAESGPGLVRWSSALALGRGACTASWRQVRGASVTLRGGDGFSPSFVGRTAGDYAFEGVAACGARASDPVTVKARIVDVAPRPDAGRVLVVHAGRPFTLDGRFSSDGNGDAFALRWDQVAGRPIASGGSGPVLSATAHEPGWATFMLTATEPGSGLSASAGVQVLVLDSEGEGSMRAERPAEGEDRPVASVRVIAEPVAIAQPVTLDGAAGDGAGAHRWTQLSGPAAGLTDADRAVATVVPFAAGSYLFEHTIGPVEEPVVRERVRLEASGPGSSPPRAVAVARRGREERIVLDGSGSAPGPLRYRWTQVAGPWVALDDATAAVATFRAERSAQYAFELEVDDGTLRSAPSRVTVEGSER